MRPLPGRRAFIALLSAALLAVPLATMVAPRTAAAAGPCDPPVVNPVACENSKPGNPASEWDISGAGDASIQGFATDLSVNKGETVRFKVRTTAAAYRFDIYRLGFYGGLGARKMATTLPTATLPQNQPACLSNATTGLIDCGNWGESGSWTVPSDAVSGVYIAHLVRTDTGGDSHIVFIVRDDASTSDLIFQTSDTTWQAYNNFGGNSLYTGSPAGRAYKVSYNRPFNTRSNSTEDWLFNAEYPMIRWLEANGYDVSYMTGIDSDRRGALIRQHRTYLSVGHDEYWSGNQRANVEAARANGVNLAFFSGNEIFWKTRWEPSIDGSGTAYRTLVTYKETHANAVIDPADPPTWTGTWRDSRFSPPGDGGRPENALSGTIFMVNGVRSDSIVVPSAEGKARFWRNTSIASLAPGASVTLPNGTLGYEWDVDADNGSRPPGLVQLSTATYSIGSELLLDNGSTYGAGTATHHMTLYRAPSGSLVFSAGSVQWSWGLDDDHDRGGGPVDARMQQATVNLLADMNNQPATLQAGLVTATASTDTIAPTSTITSPAGGASLPAGTPVTVSGTASDTGGGIVGGVEVSVDGGTTWHPANGRGSWTYSFTPGATGPLTIKSRAADDSGRVEVPGAGVTVTVTGGPPPVGGSTIWPASAVPAVAADSDTGGVELGVKFRSDVNGFITGVRFYKGAGNTGTHIGSLWTTTGTRLGTATFTGETASGWQQVNFATPVPVTANTTYIASYFAPAGHYSVNVSAFTTTGVDSPPLHALASTASPNGVYTYGTASSFPTSTYQSSNYWVDVVFNTSTGPDTTPPVVTTTSPTNASTGIPITTAITATFNEAVQPATVTFTLRDPANATVPATITHDTATNTSRLTPTTALATNTTYTATISGAKDTAGNTMTTPTTWTFTTAGAPPPGGGSTIWPASAVPAVAADSDTGGVELGVKFRSDVNGFITGVRFYKGATNTGTHIGSLWTTTGTRLGTATFTGETASGWQQVNFATPVPVTANTTYVASYFAPAGHYSVNVSAFTSAGVDNPPLHALASTASPNGVYTYGTASSFPTSTYQSSNYWVDVVFNTSTGPDTTPPVVTTTSPTNASTGIPITTAVTATFNEAVQPATVTFTLRDPANATVPATITHDTATNTSRLTPTTALATNTTYTATISGAKDTAGNTMTTPTTWTFTTGTPPPPPTGPGGPILVVTNGANAYTRYVPEILRTEGLNEWEAVDLSAMSASVLAAHDVVVLGEMTLTPTQVSLLTNWVNAGGNLVALRPDKQLGTLLGLTDAASTLSDQYLRVDTAGGPGVGITGQTIQFHGTADNYTLSGATPVATLFSSSTASTPNPAVTLRSVGTSGGQAAAFTFDLARSVVTTRQGNPAWAGQERDAQPPIRSDDLFYGAAGFDPQPDWIDLNKVAIPQADEQQRLLVNLIESMNQDRKPLPRFWYLPNGKKAAVFMSGDDHGQGGTAGRFDELLANSTPGCSVANWECLRMSSYIYPGTGITDAEAASYQAQGFEVGTHVYTGCADFTPASLEDDFATQTAQVAAQLPSIVPAVTERTHCIAFSDWDTSPKTELAHGIRLDANYYYWPPGWIDDRPGMFTGSGMPMRFADVDGAPIDVFQAATQMTDESGQSFPLTINTLLDNALGPLGYYGVFTANMHTDTVDSVGSDAIIASAKARGVPVVSGRQLLTWLDGRNASSFTGLTWSSGALGFTVNVGTGATGLQAMLPATSASGPLSSLTRNGSPVSYSLQTIKGISYATFTAQPGAYVASYTVDTTPPLVSGVGATVDTTTASVTWTTNEVATSVVDYGTTAGTLNLRTTVASPVTAHQVGLTGLSPNTTYFYRVSSTDPSGNTTTFPAGPDPPASFTTQATIIDTTIADFGTGTLGAGSYISQTADGEVTLQPTVGAEFGGTTLPSGWTSTVLATNGTATVANGSLTVNADRVGTSATFGPGRSLEFVATFSGSANQHVGFGTNFTAAPWAMFTTRNGNSLSARTNNGSTSPSTVISGSWLGSPHRFRIDWNATNVVYSIDGVVRATHNITVTTAMRPMASDAAVGGGVVTVNWMRMSPYAATGTFTSRVLDAGGPTTWRSASWTSGAPTGTSLTVLVRTGDTAAPDASWSAWLPLAASGASIGQTGRYAQYQVVLSTTAPGSTPSFDQMTLRYGG